MTSIQFPSADHPRYAGYDIVGDIHGCADSLTELLELLGYTKIGGVYRYSNTRAPRQLVFLGDILDRGPKIREAVLTIRDMVEKGSAQIIMGNHEYHALSYTTEAPQGSSKKYLREHNDSHTRSIYQTLEQFSNYPNDWSDTLEWLYDWPLVLEFEQFRVAHACWDQNLIDEFVIGHPTLKLDRQFLIDSDDYQHFAGRVMNRITRGVSLLLPDNLSMTSKDGFTRRTFRVKFWVDNPQTYGDIEFQPDRLADGVAQQLISERERDYLPFYGPAQRPLFFGHYWMQGDPKPLAENIACLDYSAVKNGKLVAYRMNRDSVLSSKNFVWVNA